MRVLALDFDGVICSSIHEVFVVGLRTYASLVPDSLLVRELDSRWGGTSWLDVDLAAEPLFRRFERLVPLGNRAEDFGVALLALEDSVAIDDQIGYDAFYRSLDPEWLDSYHRRFYELRIALRDSDPEAWVGLHSDYTPFTAVLRKSANRAQLAVATAKDRASVRLLLSSFGLADLIPTELILDKETAVHKTDHLRVLADRLDVPLQDITFIDDKLNHLQRVAPLGVRPVLAAWGHNTAREHALAQRHGFAVASLENAETVLFEEEANG